MKKELKVFEMFAGYGGASWGLKLANIPHKVVGFSEIDKYAKQMYFQNHGEVEMYGDATKIVPEELPDFDLLTGGFPCQAFSIAGRRKGFEEARGTLFFDICRIAEVKKPKYMLLENVRGLTNHDNGKTFQVIIRSLKNLGYGVIYKVLNSKEHGIPQNRERIWIVCKLGGWDFMEFQFPEKEKLNISVKDLLEDSIPEELINRLEELKKGDAGLIEDDMTREEAINSLEEEIRSRKKDIDEKYYLSEKQVKRIKDNHFNPEVAHTLTGGGNSGGNHSDMDGFNIGTLRTHKDGEGFREIQSGVCPTIPARAREDGSGQPIIHSTQPRSGDPSKGGTGPLNRSDGVTYCVDTGNSQCLEISPCLTTELAHGTSNGWSPERFNKLTNNWRRLTPKECFRLMGFLNDEVYFGELSDTQLYKLAGNGWDVNLVSKIVKRLFGDIYG